MEMIPIRPSLIFFPKEGPVLFDLSGAIFTQVGRQEGHQHLEPQVGAAQVEKLWFSRLED